MNIKNLSKLGINETVKNYKAMCKLLDEPLKGGCSKAAQLKEWKRYFNFYQQGQKFIVTEIYDNPLRKQDKRSKGNRSTYVEHIKVQLVSKLMNEKEITMTKNQLYESLGMVNLNYNIKDEIRLPAESKKDGTANLFFYKANSKLKKILMSALSNLKSRNILDYWEEIIIFKSAEPKVANSEETKKIMSIEQEVIAEMGFKNKNDVLKKNKSREYYGQVNKLLQKRYGWKKAFRRIKLISNDNKPFEEISEEDLLFHMKCLNEKIISALHKNAHNFHEKNRNNLENARNKNDSWGKQLHLINQYSNFFDFSEKYLAITEELLQKLIKIYCL